MVPMDLYGWAYREVMELEQFKDGAVKPFVTPTFDGSRLDITEHDVRP